MTVLTGLHNHHYFMDIEFEMTTTTNKDSYQEYQRIRSLRSLKWQDSVLEKLPVSFCRFAEERLLASIPPQRQGWSEKQRLLCGLLHLLIVSGVHGKTVKDSRSTSKPEVRKRLKLWDLLIDSGWATMVPGHRQLKYQTRYFATVELLQQIQGFESIIFPEQQLIRNPKIPGTTVPGSLVFGHAGKRDLATGRRLPLNQRVRPLALPEPADPMWNTIELFELVLQMINDTNKKHDWKVQLPYGLMVRPSVTLRQVHVGAWGEAYRCYTKGHLSAQSMSPSVRRTITIDGESTVELDYSGMFMRMLYHTRQLDVSGDPYRPNSIFQRSTVMPGCTADMFEVLRGFTKKAVNICLNSGSKAEAVQAIDRWFRKSGRNRKWVRQVIHQTEGLSTRSLLDRLEDHHAQVKDQFYTGVGMRLMTLEASIMLATLVDMSSIGRPVLGIHDGLLCRQSDADFAEQAMIQNYQRHLKGFLPQIKRSCPVGV